MALGPQRKIFALGMYISCCLCQFGHPTQTRFSVEYGLNCSETHKFEYMGTILFLNSGITWENLIAITGLSHNESKLKFLQTLFSFKMR